MHTDAFSTISRAIYSACGGQSGPVMASVSFMLFPRLRGRHRGLTGIFGILIFLPDAIGFYNSSNRLEAAVFIIPYSKLPAAL